MDFRSSSAREALRAEVEDFLASNLTQEMIENAWVNGTIHDDRFHHAVARRGWIGATWPEELGGGGRSFADFGAFWEAVQHAGAPVDGHMTVEMIGTVIVRAGTAEQRARLLPKIISGDLLLCLGYSESEAGSDVAAVNTRASQVDGGYVINGAKMFTSFAHVADYVFLLTRTDTAAAKHHGLTTFLVPMITPGVQVRPIETFGGERTNATFYDDVFVPDSLRIGDENAGWQVLGTALDVERAMMGAYVGQAKRVLDDVINALHDIPLAERPAPESLVEKLAMHNVALEAAAALNDRVACSLATGEASTAESAMTKLMVTDVFKALSHAALDIIGPSSLLTRHAAGALVGGRLEHAFRHSQIATIYGGANEIQRNIVAYRALGLPRS